jgi:DNA polymerase I-like protein with 3'-5' exonuclease and polymerase domains
MPYECHTANGEVFDYNNPDHIKRWKEDWYLNEEPALLWQPTDVHSVTTQNATGLTPDHPDFKRLRTVIGKKVNFMKNYGAQLKRVTQVFPDKTPEEIKRINDSYYISFPGVKEYHNYCYSRANQFSYTENLFGIRYYGVSGHKLINMLVQGSSAFYLKWKIREAYKFFKENNIKSKAQMNIHDEISWECFTGEEPVFFKVKELMEHWPDTSVPIVAEMDITKTTWADKKTVHNLEEIQGVLNDA